MDGIQELHQLYRRIAAEYENRNVQGLGFSDHLGLAPVMLLRGYKNVGVVQPIHDFHPKAAFPDHLLQSAAVHPKQIKTVLLSGSECG